MCSPTQDSRLFESMDGFPLFCAPCTRIREIVDWNPESWVLESGLQLKDSRIPLTIGIRNPSSTDRIRNPIPGIQNPRCGIQNPKLSWIPLDGSIL